MQGRALRSSGQSSAGVAPGYFLVPLQGTTTRPLTFHCAFIRDISPQRCCYLNPYGPCPYPALPAAQSNSS